ncbi:MAG: hypothetical protein UV80_C0006G0049 [Candidatus Peregrinibacteria bacterium GW2011_GWF2_43_17]|nr:MAG: hypothetical protein UV80_C0006G0049 [Candidatus Peregrinibacteria bacterium GW2011_GWF2_43_17]KKT19575.1 MAG: hypothetical protein UW03_C0016G0032 [Candidatus Peregrinibacteria bacterium GW2011_GWA2_43_8]HAU39981.1 hypothetical protein [Candidatus Peregrinibacteria bacterium]
MIVKLLKYTGPFAENKDVARKIRVEKLIPTLDKNKNIILDFEKIEGATQSFIHALISDLMRKYGIEVLDKIQFKSCNDTVKGIISIVTDYMQESI